MLGGSPLRHPASAAAAASAGAAPGTGGDSSSGGDFLPLNLDANELN